MNVCSRYPFCFSSKETVLICGEGLIVDQFKRLSKLNGIQSFVEYDGSDNTVLDLPTITSVICICLNRAFELRMQQFSITRSIPLTIINSRMNYGRIFVFSPREIFQSATIEEEIIPKVCESITNEPNTSICFLSPFVCDSNVGDSVTFEFSKGMTSLNNNTFIVNSVQKNTITIAKDSSQESLYLGDAVCFEQRKQTKLEFKPLTDSINNPQIAVSFLSPSQPKTSLELHKQWEDFVKASGETSDTKASTHVGLCLAAFAATEIMKFRGSGLPIQQWAYFDFADSEVKKISVLVHGVGPVGVEMSNLLYPLVNYLFISDGLSVSCEETAYQNFASDSVGEFRVSVLARSLGRNAVPIKSFFSKANQEQLKEISFIVNTTRMDLSHLSEFSRLFRKPIVDIGFDGVSYHIEPIIPFITPSLDSIRDRDPFCRIKYRACANDHYGNNIVHSRKFFRKMFVRTPNDINSICLSKDIASQLQFFEKNIISEGSRVLRVFRRFVFKPQTPREYVLKAAIKAFEKFQLKMIKTKEKYVFPEHEPHNLSQFIVAFPERVSELHNLLREFICSTAKLSYYVYNGNCGKEEKWAETLFDEVFGTLSFPDFIKKLDEIHEKKSIASNSNTDLYYRIKRQLSECSSEDLHGFLKVLRSLIESQDSLLYPVDLGRGTVVDLQKQFLHSYCGLRCALHTMWYPNKSLNAHISFKEVYYLPSVCATAAAFGVNSMFECAKKPGNALMCFVNSFENIYVQAKPISPKKFSVGKESFSDWDYWDIDSNMTIAELSEYFKKTKSLELLSLLHGTRTIYQSFAKAHRNRLSQKISSFFENESVVVLNAVFVDEDDEDVETPMIKMLVKRVV